MPDAINELDRVIGGLTLRSIGAATSAGEWDYLRTSVPRRTLRILTGAGYLTRHGDPPDIFASHIVDRVPGVDDSCDALRWYIDTALEALAEERLERRRARHLRVARAGGHRTYYERRVAQARAAGYPSLYAMRVARGWGAGHDPETVGPGSSRQFDWRTSISEVVKAAAS